MWDTLSSRALVPVEHVRVVVEKGWITLSGEVEWDYERRSAEKALRERPGVVGISDLIGLRKKPTPAHLAQRIQCALEREAGREAKRIRVEVPGDEVTPHGEVNSGFERATAQGAVWSAPGVAPVFSELRIRS